LVRRAWASSAGNPLLLEQIALAIGGAPDAADEDPPRPWHISPDRLLLRRFGGLPAAGLRLARAASVLGSRFPSGAAVALARLTDDEADLALDALSTSGLVRDLGLGSAAF